MVTLKTTLGDIKLKLYEDTAPISTENFLQYARDGHYDGTIFHRVIDGFMIQGGGMDAKMAERKTRKAIKNESSNGISNKKYTVAMARTNVPDSATAQFFINTSNNGFLDKSESRDGVGYAVFGEVVEGQDIVDQIGKVKTGTKSRFDDVPLDAVEILSVVVEP